MELIILVANSDKTSYGSRIDRYKSTLHGTEGIRGKAKKTTEEMVEHRVRRQRGFASFATRGRQTCSK